MELPEIYDLVEEDEEWLETSIRDRLATSNQPALNQPTDKDLYEDEVINEEYFPSLPSSEPTPTPQLQFSPTILPRTSGLTGDNRISQFATPETGDAIQSGNITITRKGKGKSRPKDHAPLDVLKPRPPKDRISRPE
jgi:hypothetical protein